MPYIPFTEEQKVMANSVDLAEFLRMRGEKLERVGREHKGNTAYIVFKKKRIRP